MSQNRYYWGVCLRTLAEWSGHEPEELHDLLKGFLQVQTKTLPNGYEFNSWPTTTTLTVEEFSDYVDKVVRWAAEQGVRIPEADEVVA